MLKGIQLCRTIYGIQGKQLSLDKLFNAHGLKGRQLSFYGLHSTEVTIGWRNDKSSDVRLCPHYPNGKLLTTYNRPWSSCLLSHQKRTSISSVLKHSRILFHHVSPFHSRPHSVHVYQQHGYQEQNFNRSNGSNFTKFKGRLWAVTKVICFATGAAVWIGGTVALLLVDEVKVEEIRDVGPPVNNDVKLRALTFYDVTSEHSGSLDDINVSEDIQEEMTVKERAFRVLWNKLKDEETVRTKFGDPVQICGFRCAKILNDKLKGHTSAVTSAKTSWHASCYVEGSEGVGILKMRFERPSYNAEWIITSAHLEMLEPSREVLCDVSGSLPNGIKNFTRLSKNL